MAEKDTTVKNKSWIYIVIALIVIVLIIVAIMNKPKVNTQLIPVTEESNTAIIADGKPCEQSNTIQCSDDASRPCMCTEEKVWQCLTPCASGETCNKLQDGLPLCNNKAQGVNP